MPTAGNLGISAVALIRPHHHVKVPQREIENEAKRIGFGIENEIKITVSPFSFCSDYTTECILTQVPRAVSAYPLEGETI